MMARAGRLLMPEKESEVRPHPHPVVEANRREVERLELKALRLAQGLRLIRDTCPGVASKIAGRALIEAGVPDPPEEGDLDG